MSQPMKQPQSSDTPGRKWFEVIFVAVCLAIGVVIALNLPIDNSPYGQMVMQPWIITTEDRICDFGDPNLDGNVPVYGQIKQYTLPTSMDLTKIARGKVYSIEYKPSEGNTIVGLSDAKGKSSIQYLDECPRSTPYAPPPSGWDQPVEPTN